MPWPKHAEWVWIYMGEAEKADASRIPEYPWFIREGWKARTGHLYVKCNYKFIIDNLLNMAQPALCAPAHHRQRRASSRTRRSRLTRNANTVRLARKMYDIEPPPTYKKAGGFEGQCEPLAGPSTSWAPSSFEFHTGVIEAGHEPPLPGIDQPRSNARILDRATPCIR